MKKTISLLAVAVAIAAAVATPVSAIAESGKPGALTPEMLGRIKASQKKDASTTAFFNALASTNIDYLAKNAKAAYGWTNDISHKVPSSGVTDQKSSGRCWLFTGLNVLRAQMMAKNDLPQLQLSQNYNFFYDQLEKANLFLQGMIDYAGRPDDDRMVDWLFANPLSDGGQYTGLSDNISKYGVVPAEVMFETVSSNNTGSIRKLISTLLRKDGLELRKMYADKASASQLAARKEEMLGEIYRMLALTLGEPPTEFTWTRKNAKGDTVSTKTYTPLEFYNELAGNDLKNDYVMLMNDPTREYHKLYEIDYDRHTYDGQNWTYINLPVEEIKKMAIESIKDSTMMYFSCDVGKCYDSGRGVLDPDIYDYESLMGVNFDMTKEERIRTHASASSHAMALMGVDLDENGKPRKWMVENSWGSGPNNGHLIMTDRWFDDYMFRLVVNRKYVPAETLRILDTEPVTLPAWDPLFAPEQSL